MKSKYTGKLTIGKWDSPLEINFLDGFHDYKLNDKTIIDNRDVNSNDNLKIN